MKASTAAILLRALRSRIEDNRGVFMVGMHECYALWAAYEASGNDNFLGLLNASLTSLAQNQKMPSLIHINKQDLEIIRTGYKSLDTKGSIEYKFPDLEALHVLIEQYLNNKAKGTNKAEGIKTDSDPTKLPNTDAFVAMMEKLMNQDVDPSKMN